MTTLIYLDKGSTRWPERIPFGERLTCSVEDATEVSGLKLLDDLQQDENWRDRVDKNRHTKIDQSAVAASAFGGVMTMHHHKHDPNCGHTAIRHDGQSTICTTATCTTRMATTSMSMCWRSARQTRRNARRLARVEWLFLRQHPNNTSRSPLSRHHISYRRCDLLLTPSFQGLRYEHHSDAIARELRRPLQEVNEAIAADYDYYASSTRPHRSSNSFL